MKSNKKGDGIMQTISLPGVVFPVSQVCFGTAYLGSREDEKTSFALLDFYYEQGGRFLNTAHEYGDDGASERTLGNWMRARGVRHEMVLTSKCGEDCTRPGAVAMRREELMEDINETLDRLQYDPVEFYLLHLDDPSVPVEEIMTALYDMKYAGKIRYYGCSNWSVERMREADRFADANGIERFLIDEIQMNLARNIVVNHDSHVKWLDEEYIAYHRDTGMAVGAYSPLAMGALTKLIHDGDTRDWSGAHKFYYGSSDNFEIARRIDALAKATGYTPTQIQIAYLCSQPYSFPVFPIVGGRTVEQLRESLIGASLTLERDMIDYLTMRRDAL